MATFPSLESLYKLANTLLMLILHVSVQVPFKEAGKTFVDITSQFLLDLAYFGHPGVAAETIYSNISHELSLNERFHKRAFNSSLNK